MTGRGRLRIGTAGWAIPSDLRADCGAGDSALTRYATLFEAVEINSSFYRPHRPATYARWAASVPEDFRFSVKLPRSITHECRLAGADALVGGFLAQISELGPKLGPLLIQLPPSLAFDLGTAEAFLATLRRSFEGDLVCEPRHPGWFEPSAERLLDTYRVARVAADPAPVAAAGRPGGTAALMYWRLHGVPRTYYSDYAAAELDALAARLSEAAEADRWVLFDNTAEGHAARNALSLARRLAGPSRA